MKSLHKCLPLLFLVFFKIFASSPTVDTIHLSELQKSNTESLLELLECHIPDFTYLLSEEQGYQIVSRSKVYTGTAYTILLNGVAIESYYRNGASLLYNASLIPHLKSIIVTKEPTPFLSHPSGSIQLVLKDSCPDLTIRGTTSFQERDNMSYTLSGAHQWNRNNFQCALTGHVTERTGNREHRLFGFHRQNLYFVDTKEELLPIGDTGAVVPSVAPFSSPGEGAATLKLTFRDFTVHSLFSTHYTPIGSYILIGSDNRTLDLLRKSTIISNTLTFNKRVRTRDSLQTALSYQTTLSEDENGVAKSNRVNEQSLKGQASYALNLRKNIDLALGVAGRYTVVKVDSAHLYDHTEGTASVSTHISTSAIAHSTLSLDATGSRRFGLFLKPRFTLALFPERKHSLSVSLYNSRSMVEGEMDRKQPSNPHNFLTDQWSYEFGHLFTEADTTEIAHHPSVLGRLIPPTFEETLIQKSKAVNLASTHSFHPSFSVRSHTSLEKSSGGFLYNSIQQRYLNGSILTTLTSTLSAEYHFEKLALSLHTSIQKFLSRTVTTQVVKLPSVSPEWNSISQSWVPNIKDTMGHYDDTVGLYQYANDAMKAINVPTVMQKLHCTYQATEKLQIQSSAKLYWALRGRTQIHANCQELKPENSLFGLDTKPVVKVNASLSYRFPLEMLVTMGVKNLLGSTASRHSFRWTETTQKDHAPYYNVDQRHFTLSLHKEF